MSLAFTIKANGKVWHYRQLTNNHQNEWSISVDGGTIAWRRDGHIIAMDYNIGESYVLTKDMDFRYHGMPSVSNGSVAWRAYDIENHRDTIFQWDGVMVKKIAEYGSGEFDFDGYPPSFYSIEPSLDDGQIAYSAWDGNDYEIFLWDGLTTIQVTDNLRNDYEAQLSNGEISWTGINPFTGKPNVFFWNGVTIQNVSNDSPWTCEDSNLNEGRIVYAGMQIENGYSGDRKPDIFLWENGGPAKRIAVIPGFDYEPEIYGGMIGWTGWPYGKGPFFKSVAMLWDGYKLFNALDSRRNVSFPHFDGNSLFLLADDGNDNEVLWGTYIANTYQPSGAYIHTIKSLPADDRIYIANGKGGLEIASLDSRMTMGRLSSLDTRGEGIYDIKKAGNFLFLANREGSIDIVDISDASDVVLAQSVSTLDSPKHIAIHGDYLFTGDRRGGFRVIDISSPNDAFETGSLDLPGMTLGVAVMDNIAYVANYDRGLRVIDVENPEAPVLVNTIDTIGAPVWDVKIYDNHAYVVCPGFGIKAMDLSDPIHPVTVSACSIPDGSSANSYMPPLDIALIKGHAFVANGTQNVVVINVSDPGNLFIEEVIETGGFTFGVSVQGRYLYVSDGYEGMHIIDINDYMTSVYDDGEDGQTSKWSVYDKDPPGARIQNVYLPDKQTRAIQVSGTGTLNGYRLYADRHHHSWDNSDKFYLEWSMNYSEAFKVYIETMTSMGKRFLTYQPVDEDGLGTDTYVYFGVGTGAFDGQWRTFYRDLQADLDSAQPGNRLLAVNGFLIRGSGMVDDIKLYSLSPGEYDRDIDGIFDLDENGVYGTNPAIVDSDVDGMDDGDELDYWGDSWSLDHDADGLVNLLDDDSDNDGYLDGFEIKGGYDPADAFSFPQAGVVYEDAEDGEMAGQAHPIDLGRRAKRLSFEKR